jgi:hypothetical protein
MYKLSIPFYILLAAGIGLTLTACQASDAVSPVPLSILPKECELLPYGQIGLTINGVIAPDAKVNWIAQRGLIIMNSDNFSALYTAPAEPGMDQITVTITPSYSGGEESLNLPCEITATEIPSPTIEPTVPLADVPPIVISEVMSHVCGGDDYRRWNQYVELYNRGDYPVNVGGWFLFDEGERGTPDTLISWGSRFASFDPTLVTDTTIIPPGGFAIILSPDYPQGPLPSRMPYHIQPGTIILTVADDGLGDDFFRIIGNQPGYDTLTLYIGSHDVIHQVVDTYGTPAIPSPYPQDIKDNRLDTFPYYLSACTSIERINPNAVDSESNWQPVTNGSPGDGPY